MLERFKHEKGVHASHDKYNKAMKDVIDQRWKYYISRMDESQAIIDLGEDIQKIRKGVKKMLVEQSVIGFGKGTVNWKRTKVNDLITPQDIENLINK